ncbi:MAG: ATP synthase F1 subunit epsilon [Phycisphaerales bacterium]|nr:ATP synthase F1 subunit epsilon [Planctomycetota bacterium]
MSKNFRCQIVTPSAEVFDGEVSYVDLPAWDGQMGVMASRSPLLVELGAGILRLDGVEGGTRSYVLREGFAQMDDDCLTLLTEVAEPVESIDLAEAEQSLAAANADLASSASGQPRSPEAIEEIAKRQRVAMQRIAAARGRTDRR